MKVFLREILGLILLAVAIFLLLQVVFPRFEVVGSSMEPNLHDGQRLLVNKAVYFFREPEAGEVIVFQPPNNRRTDYIKRIIALPGDTVEVKAGVVYVNGSPLDEPYIKDQPSYTLGPQKIPEDSYFVLGDNRNNSNDSHNGWTVPRQNIVGKAWISIWPPGQWGVVTNYKLTEQLTSSMSKQATGVYVSLID
ncbi:MAG: signal peptidase I [Chloroflexi bacterium]|nr:MAG: signal peptidase I [Chloroflexota bacterium]